MDVVTERPERFVYTNSLPALTDNNARLAKRSFEAFRRTIQGWCRAGFDRGRAEAQGERSKAHLSTRC